MEILFIIILSLLVIIFAAYLIAIAPARKALSKEFATVKYAHRGLHDLSLPENSLPAFVAAVEQGFGIELDVRLTRDEVMVVFHDDNLRRMCNKDVRVASVSYAELCEYTLLDRKAYRQNDCKILLV